MQLFKPFYGVLAFWLMIIFACFGLVAPRTVLSIIVIGLCAISLSSVTFVVLDLSRPYGGYFTISSNDAYCVARHARRPFANERSMT